MKKQKEYKLKKHRDMSDLVYAMRLIIEWERLREHCLYRTSCHDCPYWINLTCTKKTTKQIMNHAAEIFIEYLE